MSSNDDSDYESQDRIDLDVDFNLATYAVGYFNIDITSDPVTNMGDIRYDLSDILGISMESLFLTYNNVRLHNAVLVKDYLEEVNQLYHGDYLRVELNEVAEQIAAKNLELRVNEALEIRDGQYVILMDFYPNREIELTIFVSNFKAYMRSTFPYYV